MAIPKEILEEIKIKIIQGYYDENGKKIYPSLKEAARLYDVSYRALREEAPSWNWREERRKYQSEVARKIREKKDPDLLSDVESILIVVNDVEFAKTASKLREAVNKQLDKIIGGETGKSTSYHLMNLGKALESAQKVAKTAAGEPSNIQQVRAAQDVKLDITDDDFMEKEIEFAKKLITQIKPTD